MSDTSNAGSKTCNELHRWLARTVVWKQDLVLKTRTARGRYCSSSNFPNFRKTLPAILEQRRAPEPRASLNPLPRNIVATDTVSAMTDPADRKSTKLI